MRFMFILYSHIRLYSSPSVSVEIETSKAGTVTA